MNKAKLDTILSRINVVEKEMSSYLWMTFVMSVGAFLTMFV